MDAAPEYVAVGDRLWVVLLAYFLVFLPWTVIQAVDFIGPEWKTVHDTRRDGFVQFIITLIPVFAISFYIYSQVKAVDYKEMSAAIVALFFAASHLASTWWGLWQLDQFRRWAVSAIRVLGSQGTEYKLLRDYEQPPKEGVPNLARWKADQIKVNDSIIDNSIFTGKTRCYAVRGSDGNGWMQLRERRSRLWYSKLTIVAQSFVVVLGSLLMNMLHFAGRACKLRKKHTEHSPWKLRPYEPVDVWINWAVAFAAQGLDHWIDDFDAISTPMAANKKNSEGYQDRQSYFAREVLTSAVLLMPDRHFVLDQPDLVFGEGHPLRWGGKHAAETRFGKKGKVDKMDMLQQAILSGKHLPFDAPHASKERTENVTMDTVSDDLKKSGYKSYDYDLKEAVGDMPSKFGNAIDKFTIDMLEWLTILLNVGIWEQIPKKRGRSQFDDDGTRDFDDTSRDNSDSDSSSSTSYFVPHSEFSDDSSSAAYSNMKNGYEIDLHEGSGPVTVLRTQLGITGEARPLVTEKGKGFAGLPLPLKQVGIGGVLWENRGVLKVSAAIDNWVAFNAGDCLTEVLKYDPEWKQACLTISDQQGGDGGNENSVLSRRRSLIQEELADSKELAGKRYMVYANDILERLRFTAQFGTGETTDLHLDQTISFVGVVMENVRSALATGLSRGGLIDGAKGWTPAINFCEGSELLTSPFAFTLSESVTCALRSCEADDCRDENGSVMTRPIEMRLLWELQSECQGAFEQETIPAVATPGEVTAMIACILGFPALSFTSKVSSVTPIRTSRLNGSSTSVSFAETTRKERAWNGSITPICAPQELYVAFSIAFRDERGRDEKGADISVRLARNTRERDGCFEWEAWRDAFNGRLRGLRKWQERQGVNVMEEFVTDREITLGIERWKLPDPRTGSQLRVWAGWLPHRPQISIFELSSEGVIRQYAISGKGMDEEGKPIAYMDACQEDLTYSLGAVEEKLFEVRDKERPKDANGGTSLETLPTIIKPVDPLVQQGKGLLARKKRDLRGALECFELAARNDNIEGLQQAVDILLDKNSGQANLAKALFLTKHFGWMYGSRYSSVQERASVIEDIYQKLLECSNYECAVVLGLAMFEVQRIERMEFNGSVSTCDVMNLLARTFRQTGQIEMIKKMVVLSAHCAWLRTKINPLGTDELLPVSSWGSWLLSASCGRAKLEDDDFGKQTRNRNLLEIFLYAAGKSMNDWRWLEGILVRDDILFYIGVDALNEMTRKQDGHAQARNRCIVDLLRGAMSNGDRQATALLGDIYERGIAGVRPCLSQAVGVYGLGATHLDPRATERLGAIAKRTEGEVRAIRPRILELLNLTERQGNAKAGFVLADMYENGLGGVEVDLPRAVEFFGRAAILSNDSSAERLGQIACREGVQSRGLKSRALELLRKAVEARSQVAASVLGRIYESGVDGLTSGLVQAVEFYLIGMKQSDSASADRLATITARDDGQTRTLRPHILRILYEALTESGNQLAARVLGDLCEEGLDIWTSYESYIAQLLTHRWRDIAVVELLGKMAIRDDQTALQHRPPILDALENALGHGIVEAASAVGEIYERDDISFVVEIFGSLALQGDFASASRLGKIALRTEGKVRMRAMELLREVADLEYVHAVSVQAAVLEHDAENGNGDMSTVIELFAQAGLAGSEGSTVRLRDIAVRRYEDEVGNRALERLLDVAWRESCSEHSETEALVAVGHVLSSVTCRSAPNAKAALTLFEDASARIYCHQYSTYHQLEVAFSAARGLMSLTRNAGVSETVKQRAGLLLEEYVEDGKEGPMEFYAANLVHASMPPSHESMRQAVQMYMKLMNMENANECQQGMTSCGKAELIGETEISAMTRVVAFLETDITASAQDREIARQLGGRCELLEEEMKVHRERLNDIADVLEF